MGRWLLGRALAKDLGATTILSLASEREDNKVFVHWRQHVRDRAPNSAEEAIEGITVLLFNASAQIAQVGRRA